jgi:serine phosphatase RsbU (regulator of sigma subunit)
VDDERELRAALRGVLDAVENASPVQAVEAATRALGAALGSESVSFLILDLSGRAVVRLSRTGTRAVLDDTDPEPGHEDAARHDGRERAVSEPLHRDATERALSTQTVQVVRAQDAPEAGGPAEESWTVLAPVTERGEALGLLELVLPVEPSAAEVAEIARTAHLLGFVVVAGRRHTDLYEWAQRSTPYSLAAEIQRRLLPDGYTCEAGSFTLSAWLEPSADVGGDTYDYSLARDVLHLSMTDAMGHGVASALTATLCVGALRNARRHGQTLLEQADAANAALCAHQAAVGSEGFSTGLLGRLDLATGDLELVNAGHAEPYLLRDGVVQEVHLPTHLPLGLFPEATYTATVVRLRPGDRLVLVTDGMLERNAEHLDLRALIAATAHLHPREATRDLTDRLLDATGHALTDDATLLVLDWHAHHGRGRRTRAGTPA